MLKFHATGDWRPEQVQVLWVQTARRIPPEVARAIDQAWDEALRRPGVKLFDGPMCRIERWDATPDRLSVELSPTGYKAFMGTNLSHPEFAEQFGRDVMANPAGVSPALHTADNFLLLGRRNQSLAYYPGRTHPFAGALEPRDGNPFTAIRRELAEELSLTDADVAEIRCTGIAEDTGLRQPEMLFRVRTLRTRSEVQAQVSADEHGDSVAIPATPADVARAIQDPSLTPVAVASLLLWGRVAFGQPWFKATAPRAGELTTETRSHEGD